MTAAFVSGRRAEPALGRQAAPGRETAVQASGHIGPVARLWRTLARVKTRQAERAAGAYIEAHGGRLTDQLERRILEDLIGARAGRFGM